MKIKMHYVKKLAAWLLPNLCIFCQGSTEEPLCKACFDDLPKLTNPCYQCARPLPTRTTVAICGECLKQKPAFDRTYALFAYVPPLTRFVMQLKFNHALINAKIFSEIFVTTICEHWYRNQTLPDLLIPMPLHFLRLRERGFNQALEIAKPIAKKLQIKIDKTHCQRIKHTAAQATLPAKDRHQNVKNAFQINADYSGLHIAVIDDVITTGKTMEEFCAKLKSAGAAKIDVWACARAIP